MYSYLLMSLQCDVKYDFENSVFNGGSYHGIRVGEINTDRSEEIVSELKVRGLFHNSRCTISIEEISTGNVFMMRDLEEESSNEKVEDRYTGPYRIVEICERDSPEECEADIVSVSLDGKETVKMSLYSMSYNLGHFVKEDSSKDYTEIIENEEVYQLRFISDRLLAKIYDDVENIEKLMSRIV